MKEASNRYHEGLLSLSIFMLISVIVWLNRGFDLFGMSSDGMKEILGTPPPAYLISIVLVLYMVSNMVLTLTAIAKDKAPESRWSQLGYRSAFFLFYGFSGMIAMNFIPVLMVGLFLYGLDQLHVVYYEKHVQGQMV